MHCYAVVTSRGTGPLAPVVQQRLERAASSGTIDHQMVFPVDHRGLWYSRDKSTAVVWWQNDTDPFGSGPAQHESPSDIALFSGHVWPRGRGWDWRRSWADQLAGWCRSGLGTRVQELSGIFTAAFVDADGNGCVFNDPLSIGNLYFAEQSGLAIFGPRAAPIAQLLVAETVAPARDPLGSGWLAFSGVVIDDASGFAGVRVVPESTRIDLRAGRDHVVETMAHPATWFDSSITVDEAVEITATDLEAELTAISGMRDPWVMADLTGGKDSRVLLAGMLSAGVVDRFRFWTAGAPELPDRQIADHLCDVYSLERGGIESIPIEEAIRWMGPPDHGQIERYRRFAFATSGMGTPWSMAPLEAPSGEPKLNGVGGEPWYTNYPASKSIQRTAGVLQWLYRGQKLGTAEIVRPEARRHYEEVTERVAAELCEGTDAPRDVVDRYYLRIRMRRWFGTGLEVDRWNRVLPLFSAQAVAAAFSIGADRRHAQLLSYAVMARADKKLVNLRFANDVWPAALADFVHDFAPPQDVVESADRKVSGSGSRPVAPGETPPPPKVQATTATFAASAEATLDELRAIINDSPGSSFYDVVDREAFDAGIAGYAELPHQQRLQIFSAAGAGLWLSGNDQPFFPSPANREGGVDTRHETT